MTGFCSKSGQVPYRSIHMDLHQQTQKLMATFSFIWIYVYLGAFMFILCVFILNLFVFILEGFVFILNGFVFIPFGVCLGMFVFIAEK